MNAFQTTLSIICPGVLVYINPKNICCFFTEGIKGLRLPPPNFDFSLELLLYFFGGYFQ